MASCFCMRLRPEKVKVLDFRHSNLLFMPEEVFEFEETLEELYVDSNDIRDLPRSLFHCEKLKKLGASDNELYTLPQAIGNLINLQELDISKNGIVVLPDAVRGCKSLEMLEVSVNPLGRLPEGFTQLYNLSELYLNDTLLDYLPATFGRLVKLKVLELRENNLQNLPKSIARLTELERLDLGQNQFRELDPVIGSLSSLKELWLDSNKICSLPDAIGNLKNLFYIEASRNRLERLPKTISKWESIEHIQLSKNFLKELPQNIGDLIMLATFRADNNQLSWLPYSIGGLQSLQELILNANDLEELPPSIGLLRKLTHLNVDDNMLMSVPCELGSCSNISLLFLRGNYIEELPDEIGRITNLAVANFSNNRLKGLPYSFTKLKKLQALWLSENQAKPLLPLQTEINEQTGKLLLTCFLFPQRPLDDTEYDDYISDEESFHMSVYEQKRRERMKIAFDVSESETESKQGGSKPIVKTPYPKESFRPRFRGGPNSNIPYGAAPSEISDFVPPHRSPRRSSGSPKKNPGMPGLPDYPQVEIQGARVQGRRELSINQHRSPRPASPTSSSIFSDRLHLFKADKEKRSKDKARLKRNALSDVEDGSDWNSTPSVRSVAFRDGLTRRSKGESGAHSDSEMVVSYSSRRHIPDQKRQNRAYIDDADKEVAHLTTNLQQKPSSRSGFSADDMPDVVFNSKVNHVEKKSGPVRSNTEGNLRQNARGDNSSRTSAMEGSSRRKTSSLDRKEIPRVIPDRVYSQNSELKRNTPTGRQQTYDQSNSSREWSQTDRRWVSVDLPRDSLSGNKSGAWNSSQPTPSLSYNGQYSTESSSIERTRRHLDFSSEENSHYNISENSRTEKSVRILEEQGSGIASNTPIPVLRNTCYGNKTDASVPLYESVSNQKVFRKDGMLYMDGQDGNLNHVGQKRSTEAKTEKSSEHVMKENYNRNTALPFYQHANGNVGRYRQQVLQNRSFPGETSPKKQNNKIPVSDGQPYQERAVDVPSEYRDHSSKEEDVRWGVPKVVIGDQNSSKAYIIHEEKKPNLNRLNEINNSRKLVPNESLNRPLVNTEQRDLRTVQKGSGVDPYSQANGYMPKPSNHGPVRSTFQRPDQDNKASTLTYAIPHSKNTIRNYPNGPKSTDIRFDQSRQPNGPVHYSNPRPVTRTLDPRYRNDEAATQKNGPKYQSSYGRENGGRNGNQDPRINNNNWREHVVAHLQYKGKTLPQSHTPSPVEIRKVVGGASRTQNNSTLNASDNVFPDPSRSFPAHRSVALTRLRGQLNPSPTVQYEHSGGEESQRVTPSGSSENSSSASLTRQPHTTVREPPPYEYHQKKRTAALSSKNPHPVTRPVPLAHPSPPPSFPRSKPDGNSEWL